MQDSSQSSSEVQDFEESPFGGGLLPSVVCAAHWLLVGEGTVCLSCALPGLAFFLIGPAHP